MVHIPALLADFFIPHSHLSLDVPWSECMCSPGIPIEGSNSSPACLIRSFLHPFIRLVAVALNLIGWSLPVETACRLHSCWSGWILPWWLHQCIYAKGKSLEALLEKCSNIMPRIDLCLLRQWSGDRWHLGLEIFHQFFDFFNNHQFQVKPQITDWKSQYRWHLGLEIFHLVLWLWILRLENFWGFFLSYFWMQTPQNSQSNLQKCYKFSSRWWKGVL